MGLSASVSWPWLVSTATRAFSDARMAPTNALTAGESADCGAGAGLAAQDAMAATRSRGRRMARESSGGAAVRVLGSHDGGGRAMRGRPPSGGAAVRVLGSHDGGG